MATVSRGDGSFRSSNMWTVTSELRVSDWIMRTMSSW